MSNEKIENVFGEGDYVLGPKPQSSDDEALLEAEHISVLADALKQQAEARGLTAEDFEKAAEAFMVLSKMMFSACLAFEEAARKGAELCVNFAEALREQGSKQDNKEGDNGNGSGV